MRMLIVFALISAFVGGCAKTLPDTPPGWATSVTKAPDKAPQQCDEWPPVPAPKDGSSKEMARYSDKLLDTISEYQRVHGGCSAWAKRR